MSFAANSTPSCVTVNSRHLAMGGRRTYRATYRKSVILEHEKHVKIYGSGPRKHRNGLGLAVPAAEQIEILRRSVRYLLAIEHVSAKAMASGLMSPPSAVVRCQSHSMKRSRPGSMTV